MKQPPASRPTDALGPLRHRAFRVLWIATVIGNIGTWVRDVASGWAMTELSTSPLMVALVQAFGSLPLFLLALPAGALADLVDKRRLLLIVQAWLMATSLVLAALAATGRLDATALLLLTLSGGIGAALLAPTWLAVVPELVPRDELRPAVALNSLGVNISRAIGPALGGLVLSAWGLAAAYGLDVLSYLVTALALLWWRRNEAARNRTPPEHLLGAISAGLRYAFASPELKRTMLRATAFFVFATAAWALLPLVARSLTATGAGSYGLMLGAIGAGAVGGAIVLPRLRTRWSGEQLLKMAAFLIAGALVSFAYARSQSVVLATCVAFGAGWIVALTVFGATVQSILPDWVRGRGLAVHLTVFYGSMTLGSIVWGKLASASSVSVALTTAALGLLFALAGSWKVLLPSGTTNLAPVQPWPDPVMAQPAANANTAVCVTIEYRIDPVRREEFVAALKRFSGERRRNGAFLWRAYEDAEHPGSIMETFMAASWTDHQRHHDRVTSADALLQAEVRAFHVGTGLPKVRHLLEI